jgi:hypothetical protein
MEQLQTLADRIFVPPPRIGPRPRTRPALPHIQLEQWPPAEIVEELMERSLELPYVRPQQSRMASPQSLALSLPDRVATGPPDAFIDGHEFCHLHPLPEGSIHLTLPREIRASAVEMGWAEQHPAARIGVMPQALVMVYAPRNPGELAVVLELISSSYQFARWGDSGEGAATWHEGEFLA